MTLPPWLERPWQARRRLHQRDGSPQALLVHGQNGSGRRLLAARVAADLLCTDHRRVLDVVLPSPALESVSGLAHPDFKFLTTPPEKSAIPVDAVRELIGFLQMKSHQGGARVVVVFPAEALTVAAANSLLKTLEEPPADSFILLVGSDPGALPATIVSRCQRLVVGTPPGPVADAWLRAVAGREEAWDVLLEFAGGAPLRALWLHQAGFAVEAEGYARDLRDLECRRETPPAIARRWARADPDVLCDWLYRRVARDLWETAGAARQADNTGNNPLQSFPKPLTMRALLDRLNDVETLRRLRDRAVNPEIQIAALLQNWYTGATAGDRS